jgi:hypothetical protein
MAAEVVVGAETTLFLRLYSLNALEAAAATSLETRGPSNGCVSECSGNALHRELGWDQTCTSFIQMVNEDLICRVCVDQTS